MRLPADYPFSPPSIRVVRPRFKRHTGYVISGALCMELLTPQGWNPTFSIEALLEQASAPHARLRSANLAALARSEPRRAALSRAPRRCSQVRAHMVHGKAALEMPRELQPPRAVASKSEEEGKSSGNRIAPPPRPSHSLK